MRLLLLLGPAEKGGEGARMTSVVGSRCLCWMSGCRLWVWMWSFWVFVFFGLSGFVVIVVLAWLFGLFFVGIVAVGVVAIGARAVVF